MMTVPRHTPGVEQFVATLRARGLHLWAQSRRFVFTFVALLQALDIAATASALIKARCFFVVTNPVGACLSDGPYVTESLLGTNAWVISLFLWLFAMVIWMLRPTIPRGSASIFFLECQAASAALNFGAVPQNTVETDLLFVLLAAAIGILYFWSHMQLLHAPNALGWQSNFFLRLGACFIVVANTGLALLAISPWGELGGWLSPANGDALGRQGVCGCGTNPVAFPIQATYLAFAASVVVTIAVSAYGARTVRISVVKRRVRIFLIISGAAVLPIALLSMLPRALTEGHMYVAFEWTVYPLILYPFAYLYAQFAGRLARYDVRISAFVTYYGTAILLLALYLCSFIVTGPILGAHISTLTPGVPATIIAVLAAQPIGKSVRRLTRWAWADETTEPLKLAKGLAAQLAQSVDPEQLRVPLTTTLANGLCLTGAAFLRMEEGTTLRASGWGVFGWLSGRVQLGAGVRDEIIRTHREQEPMAPRHICTQILSELRSSSEAGADPSALTASILPLVLHGELVGMLLLGPRQPDVRSDFTAEEIDCLHTVANYAATALHTIRLVEERERYGDEMADLLDRERERFGENLHDGPIQSLTGLGWALDSLMSRNSEGANHHALMDARAKVTTIIEDLRAIMYSVETPSLIGFVPAVMSILDTIANERGEHFPVLWRDISDDLPDMPHRVQACLVEIMREAVINARKHARARTITVTITSHNAPDTGVPGIELDVRDNGQGFVFAGLAEVRMDRHHTGLYRMRRRAEMAGAELSCQTEPGTGTCVHVVWPNAATR